MGRGAPYDRRRRRQRRGGQDVTSPGTDEARPRFQLLDIVRGIAILMMVVFHVAWDLYYFGYSATDVTTDPPWMAFQRIILSSFLLLVGASLVLAHGRAIRWRGFWRRLAILVVAALLVSAGTYWMFPDYFVFFGVLHAIALFSLGGLLFVRLPIWAVLAGAALFLVPPALFTDPAFTARPLAWIGFWPVSPATADVVPVFPWFGVVLLGIAGMRLLLGSRLAEPFGRWRSAEPAIRGLALIGRWSLPVYLVHQPIIIGALMLASQFQAPVLQPPVLTQDAAFTQSCEASCGAGGGEAGQCRRYCACALEQIDTNGLWDAVNSASRTAEQELAVGGLTSLCRAMAN